MVRKFVELRVILSNHIPLSALHRLLFYLYYLMLLDLLCYHFPLHRVQDVLFCGLPQDALRRRRFSQVVLELVLLRSERMHVDSDLGCLFLDQQLIIRCRTR